jgi:Protein of unknown function (DUF3040)
MALSADEQRELAEIERRLATDDPGLATCLAAFRRPGPSRVLRSPRARIIGSLFTVLLVAMVSLMVYAMIPFRAHSDRQLSPTTAGTPSNVSISPTGGQQSTSPLASAGTGASATGAASSAPPSARASTSTGQAKPSGSQAAGQVTSSAAGP